MNLSSITIQQETENDRQAVFTVNQRAFQRDEEALLVDRLRTSEAFIPQLSLVSRVDNKVAGHILFTEIGIRQPDGNISQALALAPMAVLPEYQSKGIGGQLIRHGLEVARSLGYKAVIVLGHEHYYPRFGFVPAAKWNITAPFPVPSANFLALELVPDALGNVAGEVIYAPEFGL
ncbi:MAG TPA: N-acetyltransferase [Chitinophaga sp.]|uniref:GNAT family N-acetyltransferase n=1 Tax=Chitinophaga sp. TaxID=1869181 RepID=UPI002B98E7F6|nr:N-acetyltransferase [Chitinophaga sp.]HVI43785.1 N-acetyltransferase [Chitinophaga sp.]